MAVNRRPDNYPHGQRDEVRRIAEAADHRALDAQYQPIAPFSAWARLEVDTKIWQRQRRHLEKRRNAMLGSGEAEKALAVALRAAAVDSGAIEGLYNTNRGLTYTIAVKGAAWETSMRSEDERMPDFFEAQLDAYELASEIASSRQPVTEVWIRQVHEVLCRPQATYNALTPQGWIQKPLPKGEYKRYPNHVIQADRSPHSYAPVDITPAEMHRLVDEIKSTEFEGAHAVLQAAYAHYAMVAVHPFADGNGRVARAVASVFLRRDSLIPLLIWADQRTEYFDALEQADAGNFQAFVDFVFDRGIDAFVLVGNELGPQPEDYIRTLQRLHVSHGGLTFQELDERASDIVTRMAQVAQSVIDELTLPRGVRIEVNPLSGSPTGVNDPAYRNPVNGQAGIRVALQSFPPARAERHLRYRVLVARAEQVRYAFQIEYDGEPAGPLEIRLSDAHPRPTDALISQMRAWLRRTLADGLAALSVEAEQALRQAGY